MELMDAGAVDAAGLEAVLCSQAISLCESVQGTDEARRRRVIDAVVHGVGGDSDFMEEMRDELEVPASPQVLCVLEELEDVLP
jgi:hypothetical protein